MQRLLGDGAAVRLGGGRAGVCCAAGQSPDAATSRREHTLLLSMKYHAASPCCCGTQSPWLSDGEAATATIASANNGRNNGRLFASLPPA